MNNLKELEQKYQELGQEIERLKKSEVKYPIYCLSKSSGLIVKFDGLNAGIVVKQDFMYNIDIYRIDWRKHTDTDIWEQLEVCPKTGFYDGQLVWCWDDDDACFRILSFYDAKNKATFTYDGEKDGITYENYEPYEGNWPEWAQEAFKTLER